MEWTDEAILLTVAKAGKRMLVLEVLTQNHGRCRCVTSYTGGQQPMLLPGSFLTLTCSTEEMGKPLMATLSKITGGIIAETEQDVAIVVLSTVKDLLVTLLPMQQPAPEVYDAMVKLMQSLVGEDGRWPLHYAFWEFGLIVELDYVSGLARCRSAFRHGETIYMSPRTAAVVSREEAGAFLDRLMPVPGFLLGAKSSSLAAVRQAMALNTMLLERFVMVQDEMQVPPTRATLERKIKRMRDLPPAPDVTKPVIDEEARRSRLEAMRPLMVASRPAGV